MGFFLQNGYHNPEALPDFIMKEVNASYTQKKRLINQVKELESEVVELERKNNCLEKENLRIQVEQTKTDQRKSQKAANTEKSGIPCDNKTGIHPYVAQSGILPAVSHYIHISNGKTQASSNNTHSSVVSGKLNHSIKTEPKKEKTPTAKTSQVNMPTFRSLLQATGDQSKNQESKHKIQIVMNSNSGSKPTPVQLNGAHKIVYLVKDNSVPTTGTSRTLLNTIKDVNTRPSLPISIPLDHLPKEELREKIKNSSIKAEITDSKPKQVVDMDSMYSPISRPSSQGSTTDTAEEPPSISQHKLDQKKPSNIILYPTRPSNISVNNFVENVVKTEMSRSSCKQQPVFNGAKIDRKPTSIAQSDKLLAETLLQMSKAQSKPQNKLSTGQQQQYPMVTKVYVTQPQVTNNVDSQKLKRKRPDSSQNHEKRKMPYKPSNVKPTSQSTIPSLMSITTRPVGITAPNSSEKLNGMTKSLPGTPPNIKSKICVNVLRCEDVKILILHDFQ